MKRFDLALHLTRMTFTIALLVTVGPLHPLVAAALSMGLYFAAFAFTHDLSHGALRLPRKTNEWLLAAAALPMMISGHAMRLLHLRHHARPLAADDLEGVGATLPLWRAVLAGPVNAIAYRTESYRAANPRERRWIAAESFASAALLGLALISGSMVLAVWGATNIVLALGASAWASHIPHHPPAWARWIAVRLAWTGSVTLLGFAYHQAHHDRPKVPCRELGLRRTKTPAAA